MDFWKNPLKEEEIEALIEKAAGEIRKRRLEAPAILFLEMNKPLSFLASQSAIVLSPLLVPFVGFDNVNDYSRLLESRDNVERLIRKLEEPMPTVAEGKA